MAIVEADLELVMSGGAGNTNVNNSLGGVISVAGGGVIITNTDNNDMDDITSGEASAGITIYHGYYYRNTHATLTWTLPVFWIESQTSSGTTSVEIAIADEAVNVTMETIVNETTAPVGPVFTAPANKGAGIAITSLAPSAFRGTWVKYIVNAASPTTADQYTIKAEGDTLP